MAALDVGTALSNVRTMLSGLTAWQSICRVATAGEALTRIHYGAIEDDQDDTAAPCIILDVTSLPTNWLANRLQGNLTIEMRFYLRMPDAERETFSSQYIWVWQKFSAMLDGVNGAVGDAGEAMIRTLNVPLMPGRIDPDENTGASEWNFILSIGLDFI